ncbi:MAG: PLDc_N domain-containing protein [Actinomycetia bacterium]|nr:PLDc_N domain-containing protein [Actinomycetes bacterium]
MLQLILLAAALLDLSKRDKVTGGNKLPWIILILLVGTIGPIIYFVFGRKE